MIARLIKMHKLDDNNVVDKKINNTDMSDNIILKIKKMPRANEAFLRNEAGNPNTAIIPLACGDINSPQICTHFKDCPILKAYDDFIYSRLKNNEIIGIEVRWCPYYEPERKFSTF